LAARLTLTAGVGSLTEDGDEDTLHHSSQTSEPSTLGERTFIKISVYNVLKADISIIIPNTQQAKKNKFSIHDIKFFIFTDLHCRGVPLQCFSSENRLQGPKHEIFVAEFFTQFKPVWVEDLGTRKLNYFF
jgi:hypothetical protein